LQCHGTSRGSAVLRRP